MTQMVGTVTHHSSTQVVCDMWSYGRQKRQGEGRVKGATVEGGDSVEPHKVCCVDYPLSKT